VALQEGCGALTLHRYLPQSKGEKEDFPKIFLRKFQVVSVLRARYALETGDQTTATACQC